MTESKICPVCHLEFQQGTKSSAYWSQQKYCTKACGDEAHRIKKSERARRQRRLDDRADPARVAANRASLDKYMARRRERLAR